MSQVIHQIDEMRSSPEKWIDVIETVVDSMMESSEKPQHNISDFTENALENINQAIQSNTQILTPECRVQAHRESLHLIQMPALLLDRGGFIIERNDLLEHFFYRDTFIDIDSDQLCFHTDDHQTQFQDLIDRTHTQQSMERLIFQPDSDESITISIFHHDYTDRDLYTVLFSRNLLESATALDMVKTTFNLSRQEALLSLQLASGEVLKQAAHAIGVSYETARGYLKSIFAKTDCNNQLLLAFKMHHACLLPRQPDRLATTSNTERTTLNPEMIMASFALSKQEAHLALELFSGTAMKQAAHNIGVSYESARGYLKSVYAKTGCNSQIALALKIQHECLPLTSTTPQQYIIEADVDATYTLKNGRTLSYCLYGPEHGFPLIIHHTICGSRKQIHHNLQMFHQHNIKVIIVDRPGYGSSTYYEKRKLHDWPVDLEQLLNHLKVSKFSLLGIQYGAEYALACSQYFGDRICSTQLVSMETPPELQTSNSEPEHPHMQKNIRLNKRKHLSSKVLSNRITGKILQQSLKFILKVFANNPQKLFQQVVTFNSKKDRELLNSELFMQQFLHACQIGYKQTDCMMLVQDFQILSAPWHIDFTVIKQPVHIWHSRHDPQALFSSVENLIPYFEEGVVTLHLIEDDSVMTFYHQMEEIIAQVAELRP